MSSDRLRVGVLPERLMDGSPSPCGHLRLITPYLHRDFADHATVEIMTGIHDRRYFDIVVVQRFISFEVSFSEVEDFIAHQKRWGTKIVVDLDDNLLDQHPIAAVEAELQRFKPQIRLLLRNADLLTVSTKKLAERVSPLKETIVVRNALPDEWLRPKVYSDRESEDELTIGYYGTLTHQRDFMTIVSALRAAFRSIEVPCRLELCGISNDPRFFALLDQFTKVKVLDVVPSYPAFFRKFREQVRWDIGLAPLARGAFEDAKSDIKYLEYSAFSYAGIYSESPAYHDIDNKKNGIVCKNSADEWSNALIDLARNKDLRKSIVEESQRDLLENRSVGANARLLKEALDRI